MSRCEVIGDATLYLGDCRDVLALAFADDSVDAIVTDPPYELGFMGKAWDASGVAFDPATWAECLRVLKPGGHLLAFGGSRTFHRIACAIEDAGFELRDTILWVYGSGFPKSKNLDGALQGWGTALKPAFEPISVARKPLAGTVAENVLRFGTGAINVDGCRVHGDDAQGGTYTVKRLKPGATLNATGGNWRPEGDEAVLYHGETKPGRWPANLIHDGSDEVVALFPEAKGAVSNGKRKGNGYGEGYGSMEQATGYGDTGSAARFFYCAKASKADRGEGNTHPTVKPHDLMRYLCRLVTPPGGTVLDPFAGSGSTGKAAVAEGFTFVGVELNPDYIKLARLRIERAYAQGRLFEPEPPKAEQQGLL